MCALATEARHLGPVMERRADSPILRLQDETLLAVSGIGCSAAREAARALIAAGARALASWGMAGGLDPTLDPGTVCLPDAVLVHDQALTREAALTQQGPAWQTDHPWRDRVSAAMSAGEVAPQGRVVTVMQHGRVATIVHHGRLVTVAHPVGSPADKAALFRQTGAAAVDMESAAVAEIARGGGFPFIAVRVIVDSAHDSLPRAVTAAADTAGPLRLWRLIASLARAPADLAPVIRLARRYRSASRSLAAVARSAPPARHAFPTVTDPARS